MKALTFQAPDVVSLETVADPQIQVPSDAIVKVEVCAICGSDLHVYHGRERGLDAGTVMGHEFMGEIVAIGSAVRKFRRGARVVSPFTTNCGTCFYCRKGLTARCEWGNLFGWVEKGVGLHGSQAEYVRVPLADSTLFALPEGIPAETGLLLGDVLSTGFFVADQADCPSGGTVVVVGCGPVGLMAIIGARELGAGRIFAVDALAERLSLAALLGAEPINYRETEPQRVVAEATSGRGADAVLEAVGNPASSRSAYKMVRPGGVISIAGVHTEPHFAFSPAEVYDKNLTVRIGRCPARHYMERLLPILTDHRYPLADLFSHRLSLADGVHGYELFALKREGCTKVLLQP